MNEERLRELESWARDNRSGLTTSECVLLDVIAEACQEIRRLWDEDRSRSLELSRLEARVRELQKTLEGDRHAMEGAELELALGEMGSPDRARELLAERLATPAAPGAEASRAVIEPPDHPELAD